MASVTVAMMDVVGVRVRVGDGLVAMRVPMGHLRQLLGRVFVLMVLVVLVNMGVLDRFMGVDMIVSVGRQ